LFVQFFEVFNINLVCKSLPPQFFIEVSKPAKHITLECTKKMILLADTFI